MATIKPILKDLSSMKEQNAITNAVAEHCSSNFITLWQKVCDHLPKNLYFFTRKAIVLLLALSHYAGETWLYDFCKHIGLHKSF